MTDTANVNRCKISNKNDTYNKKMKKYFSKHSDLQCVNVYVLIY